MTNLGTPIYIAPEVARGERYNHKADSCTFFTCTCVGRVASTRTHMKAMNPLNAPLPLRENLAVSFGMLLYEIVERKVPQLIGKDGRRINNLALAAKIAEDRWRPIIADQWPCTLRLAITLAWAHDPWIRPDFRRLGLMLTQVAQERAQQKGESFSRKSIALGGAQLQAEDDSNLMGVELWKLIETKPTKIVIGKELGAGATAVVSECTFKGTKAAVKQFRNCKEQKA